MKYSGNITSRGLAVGEIFQYSVYAPNIQDTQIAEEDVECEIAKYNEAVKQAEEELNKRIECAKEVNADQAGIFRAHLEIMSDVTMAEEIVGMIKEHTSAMKATDCIYSQYAELLRATGDELIAERASDMMDVRRRLLRCIDGVADEDLSAINKPVILVTHDLMPSDTSGLDPKYIKGIVTEIGGTTSHSSIIARSFGIPAIAGVDDACQCLHSGEMVILDCIDGYILTEPDEGELQEFNKKAGAFSEQIRDEKQYLNKKASLPDGTRINVMVNIGKGDAKDLSNAENCDGVGLFRTEFLYMDRETLPTEEEQFQQYKSVLEAFSPNPVTLRTLDIGGDKEAKCLDLPKENNPFLGNRALRLCFDNEDTFLTQLRAALRASVYGTLKIMFPMVSGLEDVRHAKSLLKKAMDELDEKGIAWNHDVKAGVMIEIPALAVMADQLAKEVDFASVGTNDLTQYTLAADRINPNVAKYYQPYDPAVMRLIAYAAKEFNKAGKQLSVCGEMGGDPVAAAGLIGMGITNLSMGASSLAMIKKMICNLDIDRAKSAVEKIMTVSTAKEVKEELSVVINNKQ